MPKSCRKLSDFFPKSILFSQKTPILLLFSGGFREILKNSLCPRARSISLRVNAFISGIWPRLRQNYSAFSKNPYRPAPLRLPVNFPFSLKFIFFSVQLFGIIPLVPGCVNVFFSFIFRPFFAAERGSERTVRAATDGPDGVKSRNFKACLKKEKDLAVFAKSSSLWYLGFVVFRIICFAP